jgi:RNA polymerase sigma-70 factor (ECF subfamily)
MIINPESCKHLNDNELVRLSLENLDNFSCLYQRYEPELLRYIRRISGIDPEESQDILQESFIKIWRHLNEFDSGLKVSSWIYRIVHNETVSYLRKKKSFGKDKTLDAALYRNILTENMDFFEKSEIDIDQILNLLDHIPFKYREVLVLKFLEMKSYSEISDILKIPEGTVAIRINRAKKAFREQLKNEK